MAKSVKVIQLVKGMSEEIDSVVSLLTDEQIKALSECECETFKLLGLAVTAYQSTELDAQGQKDLAKAEKSLKGLDATQAKKQNAVRVSYLEKQLEAVKDADPNEHGTILADLDMEKAKELASIAESFAVKRDELQEEIRTLSNVKLLAAEQSVKDLYKFDGNGTDTNHTRPPVAGNSWLVLDLLTKKDRIKSTRGQFYLDQNCTLWFTPTGADWFKSQARPFKLAGDEGWTELFTIPASYLEGSKASFLQAVCHTALNVVRTYKSTEDWANGILGRITNDNIDMSSTGGSRNVHQITEQKEDPGYARQVFGKDLEAYALPVTEEVETEPETGPKE